MSMMRSYLLVLRRSSEMQSNRYWVSPLGTRTYLTPSPTFPSYGEVNPYTTTCREITSTEANLGPLDDVHWQSMQEVSERLRCCLNTRAASSMSTRTGYAPVRRVLYLIRCWRRRVSLRARTRSLLFRLFISTLAIASVFFPLYAASLRPERVVTSSGGVSSYESCYVWRSVGARLCFSGRVLPGPDGLCQGASCGRPVRPSPSPVSTVH